MHLLAPTIRSAFNLEEKRQMEERHIRPIGSVALHLELTRAGKQPIRDKQLKTRGVRST